MAKRKKTPVPRFAPAGAQVPGPYPREAVRKALGVTVTKRFSNDDFDDFFAERLTLYRDIEEGTEELLPPSEARALLSDVEAHVAGLRLALPRLVADLNAACYERTGMLFEEFYQRLDPMLLATEEMASAAAKSSGRRLGKLGPRSPIHRDKLLHDVAMWLRQHAGLRKGAAAGAAAVALRACGVTAPEAREAEKVVNKVEKDLRENFPGTDANTPADFGPSAY